LFEKQINSSTKYQASKQEAITRTIATTQNSFLHSAAIDGYFYKYTKEY
jgi:hypothetical protein